VKKIYYFILVVIITTSFAAGAVVRSTFESLAAMEEPLEGILVAQLEETLLEGQKNIATGEDLVNESSYILAVECTGDLNFYYKSTTQPVRVINVFKGDDIQPGEEIEIVRSNTIYFKTLDGGEYNSINIGFTNEMNVGEYYLIFIGDKINNSDNIYGQIGFVIAHIYSYSEHYNTVAELREDDTTYVLYDDVKDNEFFLMEESENETITYIKEYLFDKYPLSIDE